MSNKANLKLALLANRVAGHGKSGGLAAALLHQMGRLLFSCDIDAGVRIDPSCEFNHLGLGCVIRAGAVVERDCRFFQHVTIGSAWSGVPPVRECPRLATA